MMALVLLTAATSALKAESGEAEARVKKPPAKKSAVAVPTSHTDEFLKFLRDALAVEIERSDLLKDKIAWDKISAEAEKTKDPALKKKRLEYVALWKAMAGLHDYGMNCSMPNVFEWKATLLLQGKDVFEPDRSTRWDYARLTFDPRRYRLYLMNEDLPPWAASLRYVAAGVLAGDGDKRGMDILLTAARAVKPVNAHSHVPKSGEYFWMGAGGAQTEKAVPLWKEVLKDEDIFVRLWAAGNVAVIKTANATQLLVATLKDKDYEVRKVAAKALMARDAREATAVLREILKKELRSDDIFSAVQMVPVCSKLEQWKVAGVPWDIIERYLNDKTMKNDSDCGRAIIIAGVCLSAGREEAAMAFLRKVLSHPNEGLSLYAARTLVENGKGAGIERLAKYFAEKKDNWGGAHQHLLSLAKFMLHKGAKAGDKTLAMDVARTAFDRRDAMFQGYCFRLFEALGEMGALVQVSKGDGGLRAAEFITLSYSEKYGRRPAFHVEAIYRAKVRSVIVSGQQRGFELPDEWLAEFKKSQIAIIEKMS
ncbi:MAG: HEAT repeat domain-containing protein, partial [Planctomycetia bacterium]|nr:HEAT repeat domain-containing protein [Planctomycetia bacterium]